MSNLPWIAGFNNCWGEEKNVAIVNADTVSKDRSFLKC